jgi:hypothetical protein
MRMYRSLAGARHTVAGGNYRNLEVWWFMSAPTAVTALAPLALLHGLMHDRVNSSTLPSLATLYAYPRPATCRVRDSARGSAGDTLWSLALLRSAMDRHPC